MINNKKVKGSLIQVMLVVALLVVVFVSYFVNFKRIDSDEVTFGRPFWSFLFNDVFPKASFNFIIKNKPPKQYIKFDEGVLILEIAEDEGLGAKPSDDKYKFFAYAVLESLKPDEKIKCRFTFTEDYKPGRFKIKPTLFMYPKGKSEVVSLRRTMASRGIDVLRAWESVYFPQWKANLYDKSTPGTGIIKNGSQTIVVRNFSEVGSISGLSLVGLFGIPFFLIKLIIKTRQKSKKSYKKKAQLTCD